MAHCGELASCVWGSKIARGVSVMNLPKVMYMAVSVLDIASDGPESVTEVFFDKNDMENWLDKQGDKTMFVIFEKRLNAKHRRRRTNEVLD